MIDITEITGSDYILSILPEKYTLQTLFLHYDFENEKVMTTYSSPIHLLRYFWRRHTTYSNDMDYPDVASYLISRIKQTNSEPALSYLGQMEQQNASDPVDLHNLAFLFMTALAATSEREVFGYAHMPEQRPLLIELFTELGYGDNSPLIVSYLTKNTLHRDFLVKKLPRL